MRFEEGYPPAGTSERAPVVQALIRALRSLGCEPEVWPRLAGSGRDGPLVGLQPEGEGR
ncbi:MAG: hypothetical protein QN158_03580 [Armatimonadota bacterium]|nr:hypothetical protein [Armatimonadota bacterium]MDR7480383.1 hypothetical protein [Armatimonadota bacterium]MDR7502578.1 hypothetical protein [Armatimonadota bacterium]MDR7528298.1 hypothetical protein [Armatimonadota bacterium]MDR7584659.1 hypothetical protein [Armatimonadota bacterium]